MRPVVEAFKAAVLTDTALSGAVFVGEVAGTAPARYALIFPSSPDREQERSTGPRSRLTYSFTVHSVGKTTDAAMWVAEHVSDALHEVISGQKWGKRIVPGAGRIVQRDGEPMRKDNSVAPGVHFLVDEFELTV